MVCANCPKRSSGVQVCSIVSKLTCRLFPIFGRNQKGSEEHNSCFLFLRLEISGFRPLLLAFITIKSMTQCVHRISEEFCTSKGTKLVHFHTLTQRVFNSGDLLVSNSFCPFLDLRIQQITQHPVDFPCRLVQVSFFLRV